MQKNTKWTQIPMIPVAWGEVFDKLTILEIKLIYIKQQEKIKNIEIEKKLIEEVIGDKSNYPDQLLNQIDFLKKSNEQQWLIQEGLRECERNRDFSQIFLDLVRSEYTVNDERARIKRKINEILNSTIFEEKSYAPY